MASQFLADIQAAVSQGAPLQQHPLGPPGSVLRERLIAVIQARNREIERQLANMKTSKSYINAMILDYLVSEGYPLAAERFAQETDTSTSQGETPDVEGVRERVQIRNAILGGHVEQAIEFINDISAEILDSNSVLHFHLLQLQLIEIIRSIMESDSPSARAFVPAMQFATSQLAPRAPTDPKFLADLERTMALMIFTKDNMAPEMKDLLDLSLREKVAGEVNRAILTAQGLAPEARIRKLIRARAWAEGQAKEVRIQGIQPSDLNIGLDAEGVALNDTDAMVS